MRDFWEKLENLIGDISKVPFGMRSDAFWFLLAPILGFLFFLFLILGNWDANIRSIEKAINNNSINVKSDPNLSADEIRIDWKMDYTQPITIFENGETTYTNFFEYGNNLFKIFYEDSLIAEVVHFKETNLAGHKYKFELEMEGNCLVSRLEVVGKYDSLKWVSNPPCKFN